MIDNKRGHCVAGSLKDSITNGVSSLHDMWKAYGDDAHKSLKAISQDVQTDVRIYIY